MHLPANSVPAKVGVDAIAASPADGTDRGRDVADSGAGLSGGDAGLQRGRSGVDELGIGRAWRPDREGNRRVRRPAIKSRPEVEADQVTLSQAPPVRDAVQRGVVDRDAGHRGERDARETWPVAEER